MVGERWIWRTVRILDASLSAGRKGGPEVQEWFDGIESLVPRDLAYKSRYNRNYLRNSQPFWGCVVPKET